MSISSMSGYKTLESEETLFAVNVGMTIILTKVWFDNILNERVIL